LDVWSEKFWLGRIFQSLVAFSDRWRFLAGWSMAPVNWDRWAAPEELLVYPQDKPNCWRRVERSASSSDIFHAFSECCGGAKTVNTSYDIRCWISSEPPVMSWIFRVPFLVSMHLKQ